VKKKLDYYLSLNYPIELTKIPLDEGGGYSACIPALGRYSIIADGDSSEEAIEKVEKLKNDYIEELYRKGITIPEPKNEKQFKDVSGKFLLRIPKELHKNLIEQASENGVSLNQYVLYLLTKALNQDLTENKLTNFIKKFERIFDIEPEYDLNFDFKNSKDFVKMSNSEKNNLELYLRAG